MQTRGPRCAICRIFLLAGAAYFASQCFYLSSASAQSKSPDYDEIEAEKSPLPPWSETTFLPEKSHERPVWQQALLWVPNRLLDAVDIFKVDGGIGPTYGSTIRVTKYGQAGYRVVDSFSARAGLFGRRAPVLLESSSEMGIGPSFKPSQERKICAGEIGAGLDLGLGIYLGVCPEEAVDFLGGLFLIDIQDDDLH